MGVVYRARHLALERERALKVVAPMLSADQRFRERFKRESRLAAQVEHPNVIPVHHAGEEGGQLYMAMRLVDGVDLRSLVQASGPLDPARAVRVLSRHRRRPRRRARRGAHPSRRQARQRPDRARSAMRERVFLTDFGISRLADERGEPDDAPASSSAASTTSRRSRSRASRSTAAPTSTRSAASSTSCSPAQPPFPRDTELAKLFAHANAPPPRPSEVVPGLPPAIDEVVAKAMAKRPEDRYGSAGELAVAAAAALGEPAPDLAPARRPRRGTRRRRRRRPEACAEPTRRRLPLAIGALAAARRGRRGRGPGALRRRRLGRAATGRPAAGRWPRRSRSKGPTAITVGGANVWVASTGARAVDAIDPAKDRLAGNPIQVGGQPVSVAVGFGSIWVADLSRTSWSGSTPATRGADRHRRRRPADRRRGRRSVGLGHEWRARTPCRGWIPRTNRVDENVQVGARPPVGRRRGGRRVGRQHRRQVRVEDRSPGGEHGRAAPIDVGQRPNDLAVGFGSVWVIDNIDATLTRIDPETLRVGGRADRGRVAPARRQDRLRLRLGRQRRATAR